MESMQSGAEFMELLTVAEAARLLRLSERKLYGLVEARRVPHLRIDGRLLFPRVALAGWLAARLEGHERPLAPPRVLAGSHDPLLEWATRESGSDLALLTGGSADGLQRLVAGEAVVAGLHLREPGGDYNLAAARGAALPDLVLITWAHRRQGLLHRADTAPPAGLAAAVAHGLRFGQRQPGAGAATLLDQLLAEAALDRTRLVCHPRPFLTDSDLAAAVRDGTVDCGLGIEAAARRHGLGFVPLVTETFDLALRRRDYFEPALQALLAFARSAELAAAAARLGGYDLTLLGSVRYNA
jgi:putative molybdopterin biosynthesis protein